MNEGNLYPGASEDKQILTCPLNWGPVYKEYMDRNNIPYEIMDCDEGEEEAWFLIPRKKRPHAWKLKGPDE